MGNKASKESPAPVEPELSLSSAGSHAHNRDLTNVALLYWTSAEVFRHFTSLGNDELASRCLELRLDGSAFIDCTETRLRRLFAPLDVDNVERHIDDVLQLRLDGSRLIPLEENVTEADLTMHRAFPKLQQMEADNHRRFDDQLTQSASMSPLDIVLRFHEATTNTADGASPTLKRSWNAQPRPWRRHYGCPVTVLPVPPRDAVEAISEQLTPMHVLNNALFYAASVSAFTAKNSRPQGTKRVNPSSGALHPEEIYVLQGGSSVRLMHYCPNEHLLEELRQFKGTHCDPQMLLFGISCVVERESWKYGVRGCRYAALDIGHLVGALLYSLSRLGRVLKHLRISVMDGTAPGAAEAFGLAPFVARRGLASQQVIDPVGREPLEMVVVVHWGSSGESQVDVALELLRQCALERMGNPSPNAVFSTAMRNCVGLWGWMELLMDRCRSARKQHVAATFCMSLDEKTMGPLVGLSEDKLGEIILTRRSELKFDRQAALSKRLFDDLVASCTLFNDGREWRPLLPQVAMGFSVASVDGIDAGRYLLVPDQMVARCSNLQMCLKTHYEQLGGSLYRLMEEEGDAAADSVALMREKASHSSCKQVIAEDCGLVISMFVHSGAFCDSCRPEDDDHSSNNEAAVAEYQRSYWACGFLGQHVYLHASANGATCSGMGCFLDPMTRGLFRIHDSVTPMYHMAVGVGCGIHPDRYHYEDRLVLKETQQRCKYAQNGLAAPAECSSSDSDLPEYM